MAEDDNHFARLAGNDARLAPRLQACTGRENDLGQLRGRFGQQSLVSRWPQAGHVPLQILQVLFGRRAGVEDQCQLLRLGGQSGQSFFERLDELSEGRATFITFSPLILERWARGADFFLLAIIQQRNPHVLLVRADSPYQHLRDLIALPRERRIAPVAGMEVDIWIGLSQLGVDPETFFPRRKEPADFARFVAGEIDAYPGLISNEPTRFRQAGVDVRPLTILPLCRVVCRSATRGRGSAVEPESSP